jgi:hypothetical protein
VPVQGCAKWKITLTGGSGITVTPVSITSCGPIKPVLEATTTYDPVAKVITLTVADTNTWAREVVAPARVYAWNDSITITTPTGLVNGTGGTYLRLTGMDSTIGSTAAKFKNARLWKYDTLLAAHGQTQTLWPATASRTHTITIQVVSGNPTVFNVLLRVQAQNAYPVPSTPPDSEPAWAADDSALFHSGDLGGNSFSRHVIAVQFQPGTTQPSMQAAIDSVRGRVVGGDVDAETYLIDVPSDTTGTLITSAIAKLQSMAQVWFVDPYMPKSIAPNHRSPNDGGTWSKSAWYSSRDSTRRDAWAFEVLNAPLAWGCDTGSTAAKIALIDYAFYDVPDLRANVTLAIGRGKYKDDSSIQSSHGTRMASLIGAVGNNSQGMTGMLWKTDLRLYDYSNRAGGAYSASRIKNGIIRAGKDGANIINLSLGLVWKPSLDTGHILGTGAQANSDKKKVVSGARAVYQALSTLSRKYNSHPLVVIAAGNEYVDAYWSGLAAVKDPLTISDQSFAGQVLVVGGINRQLQFFDYAPNVGSNTGPLVDVVAPAEDVYALDTLDGAPAPAMGTSDAAALVSGIAGLLKSHDPNLKAADIKSRILWGSSSSGPDSLDELDVFDSHGNGYWVADAYGALEQASKDYGSAICGNRVYQLGDGTVSIMRGPGDSVEGLFPADTSMVLSRVAHGGDDILLVSSQGGQPETWHYSTTTSSWTLNSGADTIHVFPQPPTLPPAALYPHFSHNYDSAFALDMSGHPYWAIAFWTNTSGSWVYGGQWLPNTSPNVGSFSPIGDKIVWGSGGDAVLLREDVGATPGTVDSLFDAPGEYLIDAKITEDGDEVAVYTRWDVTNNQCAIRWIRMDTGGLIGGWWSVGTCRGGNAVSPDVVAQVRSGVSVRRLSGLTTPLIVPPSAPRPIARSYSPGNMMRVPPPPLRGHVSSKRRRAGRK